MVSLPASSYRYRPTLRQRASAIALSLGVVAIIILMLIRMGVLGPGGGTVGSRLSAVTFRSESAEKAEKQDAAKTVQKREEQAAVQPRVTPPPPPPRPVPTQEVPWIKLSRSEYAAADISKIARRPAEQSGDSGGDSGPNSAAAAGPGEGPGGARLYNAQWYREPSRAELVTYMPRSNYAGGWAMIACKTQEQYRVEDCQELGESPPGSGLARALRQAAWQFLVRPPRLNGKPQIGVWVRIRFDFHQPKEGDAEPEGVGQ